DPTIWEDADKFKPERFLDTNIDYKGLHVELLPFGAGRRGCPGIQFAMSVNMLALANLVYKFDLKLPNGLTLEQLDMTDSTGITVRRKTGPARKILGMEIVRDKGSWTLNVSQSGYVQKFLNNYRMDNGKSVSVPLGAHFKVSLKECSLNEWNVERMSKVPYVNVVGSLMYLMVCTRPDIAYAVSIVSRDQGKHVDADGFVDADYAKDLDKGRVILSLTACEDYELEQLDVKTAFLHGNLEETIYMMHPLDF
nr:cytochrome P450 71A2-like [Tanacetum cinerariifolium]